MAARLVLIAAALMSAIFIGALAGNAAIAGMNDGGQAYALPAIGDERAVLASVPVAAPSVPATGAERADCLDCSDYEAGYRWAAARGIADAARCGRDSVAFADGCAAYAGDGRAARES